MIHELDFTAPRDVREREARRLADGSDEAAAAQVLGLSRGSRRRRPRLQRASLRAIRRRPICCRWFATWTSRGWRAWRQTASTSLRAPS